MVLLRLYMAVLRLLMFIIWLVCAAAGGLIAYLAIHVSQELLNPHTLNPTNAPVDEAIVWGCCILFCSIGLGLFGAGVLGFVKAVYDFVTPHKGA
jgi:hypothetical protein